MDLQNQNNLPQPTPITSPPQEQLPAVSVPAASSLPPDQPPYNNPQDIDGTTVRRLSFTRVSQLLFQVGFASIFIVNSLYAIFKPRDFTLLLYTNPVTKAIGFNDIMIKIVMVNDMLLGILILIGWRRKLVYTWAGTWLLMVASIKLMNLVV